MLKQNIEQLQAGIHEPVTNEQMLRHGILWFTIKVPTHDLSPNEDDLLKIRRLNASSYYRELGFMLYEDVYFMLPMFLNTLPGNAQKSTQTVAMHEKTLATRHAVPLLPLFDDWPGHQRVRSMLIEPGDYP